MAAGIKVAYRCALKNLFALEQVFAYDVESTKSEKFANDLSAEFEISINAVTRIEEAVPQSDICITCTPSRQAFLKKEHVAPGTFVAAVGADNENKQELDPSLLTDNKVVADLLEQCAAIGDLHHALDQNLMTKEEVHAELGDVVAGTKAGRIIIFDSTGMALQDVVTSALAYEKAKLKGGGITIALID